MNSSSNTYLFDATRQTARPAGMWLSGLFQRLRASWGKRRAVERQMQELYRSSDRELWDMGLSRSDLRGNREGHLPQGISTRSSYPSSAGWVGPSPALSFVRVNAKAATQVPQADISSGQRSLRKIGLRIGNPNRLAHPALKWRMTR